MEKDFDFKAAERTNAVKEAKGLSKWLSVKVEISIFGHVIWSYQYPPEKS